MIKYIHLAAILAVTASLVTPAEASGVIDLSVEKAQYSIPSGSCFYAGTVPIFLPSGRYKLSVSKMHFKGGSIAVDKMVNKNLYLTFIGFKITDPEKVAKFEQELESIRRPATVYYPRGGSSKEKLICEKNKFNEQLMTCYLFGPNFHVSYNMKILSNHGAAAAEALKDALSHCKQPESGEFDILSKLES